MEINVINNSILLLCCLGLVYLPSLVVFDFMILHNGGDIALFDFIWKLAMTALSLFGILVCMK